MADQSGMPCPSPKGSKHPLSNYHFSADELRVLRECNTESFFQRSLPLGTGFGIATFYAVKAGYLKPNSRWGAAPKVVISVIIGYFMGKFSYQRKCAEKLMQLPNSKLAEVLKQRRKGGFYQSLTPDQGFGTGIALPSFGSSRTDSYSDERYKEIQPHTSLNLDTERPASSELDDTFRLNVDSPVTKFNDDLPLEPPKTTMTYDELRQKNREEYQKRMSSGYASPPADEAPPAVRRAPERQVGDEGLAGQKNKYGDVWTK